MTALQYADALEDPIHHDGSTEALSALAFGSLFSALYCAGCVRILVLLILCKQIEREGRSLNRPKYDTDGRLRMGGSKMHHVPLKDAFCAWTAFPP